MNKTIKAALVALTLSVGAVPANAFPFHHKAQTVTAQPHKNFIQRHPVLSAIGAAVVVHHFAKKH